MDIKPMLAVASTGASNRTPVAIESLAGTHIFDTKVDGVRAFLHRDGKRTWLINRNGVDISHRYPEILLPLVGARRGLTLDGEIFADDNSFETTLLRDSQETGAKIWKLSRQHPCRFVAFDHPTERVMSWKRRRAYVEDEVARIDSDRVTITPYSDDPAYFEQVRAMGMEGVVAKRIASRYQPGKRSPDWIKFKTTSRVTAIVIGYQPGNGSRAHFGNMQLVMLDPEGNPVDVGDVGSGFTDKQTFSLKARLDAGQLLCVEIEALNVTSGRKLRHPVYKGIRSDVAPIDCTIDQLDTLPTC